MPSDVSCAVWAQSKSEAVGRLTLTGIEICGFKVMVEQWGLRRWRKAQLLKKAAGRWYLVC